MKPSIAFAPNIRIGGNIFSSNGSTIQNLILFRGGVTSVCAVMATPSCTGTTVTDAITGVGEAGATGSAGPGGGAGKPAAAAAEEALTSRRTTSGSGAA